MTIHDTFDKAKLYKLLFSLLPLFFLNYMNYIIHMSVVFFCISFEFIDVGIMHERRLEKRHTFPIFKNAAMNRSCRNGFVVGGSGDGAASAVRCFRWSKSRALFYFSLSINCHNATTFFWLLQWVSALIHARWLTTSEWTRARVVHFRSDKHRMSREDGKNICQISFLIIFNTTYVIWHEMCAPANAQIISEYEHLNYATLPR